MSHSQFHSIDCLYLDMHGLIFETSVWLLAGSTRLLVPTGWIAARSENEFAARLKRTHQSLPTPIVQFVHSVVSVFWLGLLVDKAVQTKGSRIPTASRMNREVDAGEDSLILVVYLNRSLIA